MINIISIFLILYGLLAIVSEIYVGSFWEILWICYWGMVVIGVAGLRRNWYVVLAMLSLFFIPLTIWTIDWIYQATTGTPLFNISSFFFGQLVAMDRIVTYEHLLLVPLGTALLFLLKPVANSGAWKGGLIVVVLGTLFGYLSPESVNVNCFYKGCDANFQAPMYLWIASPFVMVFISYFTLNQIIKWRTKK